ncbi:MAG: alginate O-acetyltransferase AlgX-related protein [Anaerolineae bacterium]
MKKLAQVSGIVLINVVLIALMLEILLRVFAPALPGAVGVAVRWVTSGQPYQEEWTQAWQQNIDHYWALRPDIEDALQYGSPSVSFRLSTVELWEGAGIGFRTDPVDYFVEAVVVGDSFGMCFTERADCWVDQLAQQSGLGLVNLSQPVTGTTSHLRILRDFGVPLLEPNPRPLVIWQFFGNDFNDDYGLAVFRDEIEPHEADTSEDNIVRQPSALIAVLQTLFTGQFVGVPESEALFVKPYRTTYGDGNVLQFGGEYEQTALDMSREVNQIGLSYSEQAFADAQTIVDDLNGTLLVMLIPTREEVYREITAPIMGAEAVDTLASAREAMLTICDMQGLSCFDAYEVLAEHARNGEALYFNDDMHLNPRGNEVLADALTDWIAEWSSE